jgi:cell division protease FtsH
VSAITSKGTSIQGTFKHAEGYGGSKATTRFATEIPEFADSTALAGLLQSKQVVVNAEPLQTSTPWWGDVLVSFGPTLLFLVLLVLLMRRAGSAQNLLGQFSRSSRGGTCRAATK